MTPPASRRGFLQGTAAATFTILTTSALKAAPSERVNLAIIGLRGRGSGLAAGFADMPGAQITHLCDVDSNVVAPVLERVKSAQQGAEPKVVSDLRRVFDDKAVDAVVVATPDHWHALATVWGCQAGKHVYVEKPASHSLWEGRKMVEAARKYNRVVQHGTQSRSAPHYRDMVDAIHAGRIGEVKVAKAWNSQRRPDLPEQADAPQPAGLDYDIWQGPAPARPFNPNRFHYAWHWLWDFGTGDVGNDGVHDIDIARWGLDVEGPTRVTCAGGRFANRHWETPDTVYATFSFPGDKMLVFEQRDWSPYVQQGYENGVAFFGTKGYILAGRAGWQLFEGNTSVPVEQTGFSDVPHRQNWLDCIKSGARPNADIEEGHRSSSLAHLANIAFRVGRDFTFDPASETIPSDTEAAALLKRSYRPPFVIPDQV